MSLAIIKPISTDIFLLLNSFHAWHAKKRTTIGIIKKPFSKQFSRNFIKTSILKNPVTHSWKKILKMNRKGIIFIETSFPQFHNWITQPAVVHHYWNSNSAQIKLLFIIPAQNRLLHLTQYVIRIRPYQKMSTWQHAKQLTGSAKEGAHSFILCCV